MAEEIKLLVVDDEIDMCETLAYVFQGKGYRTDIATTGCQAAEKIRSASYDLAVADIRLPDMSGMVEPEEIVAHLQISSDNVLFFLDRLARGEHGPRTDRH